MKITALADTLRKSEQELAKWRFEALRSRCIILNREHLLTENKIKFQNIEFKLSQQDKHNEAIPNIQIEVVSDTSNTTKPKMNNSPGENATQSESFSSSSNINCKDNSKESINENSFLSCESQTDSYREIKRMLRVIDNNIINKNSTTDLAPNIDPVIDTKKELKSVFMKTTPEQEKTVHFSDKIESNDNIENNNKNDESIVLPQKDMQQKNKDVVVTIRTIKSRPLTCLPDKIN